MKNIIIAPIVSEKATRENATGTTCHFKVAIDANKIEIKKAVETRFNVKVLDVRTVQRKMERQMKYTKSARLMGKKADYKKAIVRLKDGHKLELYATSAE